MVNIMENTTKKVVEMEKNMVEGIALRKAYYDSLMKNTSVACKDNDGNAIVKIGYANVSLLHIDEKYQGDRVHKKTLELKEKWDWRKYDMITVVPHPETYQLSVVDGQNRTNAAILKGIEELPVKIIVGITLDEEERLRMEANMFVHQDDQIDRLKPIEKHKALLIMGDKAATDLQAMLKKYHIEYKATKGSREGRILGSYSENLYVAKHYGSDGLEFIYSIIENAKWGDEVNGYASTHVRALTNLYRVHDTEEDRVKIAEFLGKKLKETTPTQFSMDAKSKYPIRDRRMAATILLDDLLVEAGITERAVYAKGDKEVTFVKTSELGKKKSA